MKKLTLEEVLSKVDLRKPQTIAEAANQLLSEDTVLKVGDTATVVADPTYPYTGQKVKVKSFNNGFASCTTENGTSVDLMASLLIPV